MTASPPETPKLPAPGFYRHYKGQRYQVMGVAQHSETREWVVVYQALYGERGLWVRPLDMFTEEVEVNGQRVARFVPEQGWITGPEANAAGLLSGHR